MATPYTLKLADPLATLEVVGGKGSSLARMSAAGLPVPNGFHVVTAAYRRFVDHNSLQPDILEALQPVDMARPDSLEAASQAIRGLFARGVVPPDVAAAVVQAYDRLPGPNPTVAVRSSATAEDLPEASFAGQQETFLNIRGADAVLQAVQKCWASLWTARAIGYRARQGIPAEGVALAVIVQLLVAADAAGTPATAAHPRCSAGVLFTANPVTGNRSQAVISAAWGLGEAIVGGLVTPDTLTVDKASGQIVAREIADKAVMTVQVDGGTEEQPVPETLRRQPALPDQAVADLVRLGVQIEELYGMPMDLEWVLAGGELAIVQARPITALPEHEPAPPTEWKLPPGTYVAMRNNIVELMAEPLTPLFDTLGRAAINASLGRLLSSFFGRADMMPQEIIISVNQYAYFNGSLSAGQMARILGGSAGIARRMFRNAVERWTEVGRPRYEATVARWEATAWRDFPATEIVGTARELSEAAIDAYGALVGGVIPAAWISEGLFTATYSLAIKRRSDPPAFVHLLGFDSAPIQAEKALYDLAQWARTHDGLAAYILRTPATQILAQGESTPAGVEDQAWRAWRDRFDRHLQRHGHAIYNLDFATPVPADDPRPLMEACKLFLAGRGADPYARQQDAARQREEATKATLDRLGGLRRRLFHRFLEPAQKYAPLREDGLADVGLGYPLLRRMLRELGRRFAAAGLVDQTDDIFWLTEDEVEEAAARLDRGEELRRLAAVVPQRQAAYRAARRVSPPRMLPRIGRRTKEGVRREKRRRGEERLKGVAASPGSVRATGRVLHGPEDFARMKPGEVLVAAITTPAWTPLFTMAAGVVTDIGGPLSHGSIVAREYGIPAVLGTGNATQRIADGQTITVDGTAGHVVLHTSPVAWALPDPKAWYARGSLCEHLPDPVSPLFATMGVRLANQSLGEMVGILGEISTAAIELGYGYSVINGYLYLSTRLGLREIWGYLKITLNGLGMILRRGTERWLEGRARLQEAAGRWAARDPETLTPGELFDGSRELLLEALRFYTVIQAGTLPTATSSETVFNRVYKLVGRAGGPDATTFLFGFDTVPLQAEKSLYDLAMEAAGEPDLRDYLLATATEALVAQLRSGEAPAGAPVAAWQAWREGFGAHLDAYGNTIYEYDLTNPTPIEAPEPFLDAVKMYLAGRGTDPHKRQQEAVQRREDATAQVLSRARRPFKNLFGRTLGWAQRSGPVREDSLADMGMAHPQIRRLLRELGRRFAAAGAIAEADDIYWLEEGEAEASVVALEQGQQLPALDDLVQERKGLWQAQRKLIAPAILPETSRLAKIMPWSEQRQGEEHRLKGTGTSSGQVTAPACVLFGPEDFHHMKPGDVLVAVTTTPAWTPLFAMASAVVTDIGGPLSHSSIVAREYGIPAVMATGIGTRRIRSGQMITVDGGTGVVLLSNGRET